MEKIKVSAPTTSNLEAARAWLNRKNVDSESIHVLTFSNNAKRHRKGCICHCTRYTFDAESYLELEPNVYIVDIKLCALEARPASSTCCSRASSTGRSLNLRREYRCADSSAKFISIPAFLLIVSPLYHVPSAVTRKIFCRGLTSVCRAHIILHNKNTAQTYEKEK